MALSGLGGGRIGIASQKHRHGARGIRGGAVRRSASFGQPLFQHQAVQFRLADMATQIDVARQMVWHAASLKDAGRPA
jgi:alkylation response protein AidB-like acyl-CoA dehydrogenase